LLRFDPERQTFKVYTAADGLPGNDLTGWGTGFKSPSGEMFFGGFAGGAAFFPDQIGGDSEMPPNNELKKNGRDRRL
jgi:hypothetical protein